MIESEIIQAALEHYNLREAPKWRLKSIKAAAVKRAIWWAYRELTTLSLSDIGTVLPCERFEHSSILYGLQKFEWELSQNFTQSVAWACHVRGVETMVKLQVYEDAIALPEGHTLWLDTEAGQLVRIAETRTQAQDIRQLMATHRAVGTSKDGKRIYLEARK